MSGSMSIGRTMPWMRMNSWPWLIAIHFWPRTSRLPFGRRFATVTVMSPSRRLLCVLSPSPSNSVLLSTDVLEDRRAVHGHRPAGDRRARQIDVRRLAGRGASSSSTRWCARRDESSACRRRGAPSSSRTARRRGPPGRWRRSPAPASAPARATSPSSRARAGCETQPASAANALTATIRTHGVALGSHVHSWFVTYSSIWSVVEIAFEFIS